MTDFSQGIAFIDDETLLVPGARMPMLDRVLHDDLKFGEAVEY